MKYVIAGADPEEQKVVFSSYIDSDGDFTVAVNGEDLFFIDSESGKLVRYSIPELDGIALNEDGQIVVED